MERGAAQRATGATKLNAMSSRSHAVFIIIVEKSTVMAEDSLAAEDEEMEQFRGLAPGDSLSKSMPQQSHPCSVPGLQT
jgi:predicted metal-binding membrane protein